MLEDCQLFLQLCEKRGIVLSSEISTAMKQSSDTGELHLSCISIMIPVCEVLAQVLASSTVIRSVDLSDCMLMSKGVISILNALCEGSIVEDLNLKGNNISGAAVAKLGEVFLHNSTIKRLHLEWNSLGSHVDSFIKFCNGLAKNHSIEKLDMRYNQLSPICAEPLAAALRCNKSIRNIDLSWNTLGLRGGEIILDAMQQNNNVSSIGLRGNCIPEEILQKIESETDKNRLKETSKTNVSYNLKPILSSNKKSDIKIIDKSIAWNSDESDNYKIPLNAEKKSSSVTFEKVFNSRKSLDDESIFSSDVEDRQDVTRKRKKKSKMSGKLHHTQSVIELDDSIRDLQSDTNLILASDENDHSLENHNRTKEMDGKIEKLNKILQERSVVINALTEEVSTKTAELTTAKSEIEELQLEIKKLQETINKFHLNQASEIANIEKKYKTSEENLRKAYSELEATYLKSLLSKKEIDMKVKRYEKDIHKSTAEASLLKDKLISNTQAYEDMLMKNKSEMHKMRIELKERESRYKMEQNMLKSTLKETTSALEECQAQLQKYRNELRDLNENYTEIKIKLSESEYIIQRCSRLEENLQKTKEEKEILEEKLADQQRNIASLHRQVTALQSELVEPQKRYELLKESLEQEKLHTSRLTQELQDERNRIKEQNLHIEKISQQLNLKNTQINEIQISRSEVLREKEKVEKSLKDALASKEQELNDFKAEEVQRASRLYAAFNKYLGSLSPNLPT